MKNVENLEEVVGLYKHHFNKEQIFILNDDFLMILFINFYVSFFLLIIQHNLNILLFYKKILMF